jgi:hypothetical protein
MGTTVLLCRLPIEVPLNSPSPTHSTSGSVFTCKQLLRLTARMSAVLPRSGTVPKRVNHLRRKPGAGFSMTVAHGQRAGVETAATPGRHWGRGHQGNHEGALDAGASCGCATVFTSATSSSATSLRSVQALPGYVGAVDGDRAQVGEEVKALAGCQDAYEVIQLAPMPRS